MNNFPLYKIDIDLTDEETGVYTVSLVEFPAMETNFLKFSNETPIELKFNDEKHIITGCVIRCGFPVYRNTREYGEHYVVFEKDTVMKIVEKFSKYGFNNFVNIEHNKNNYASNITMLESYIIDKERGICPHEFESIEDGSWIVSYKVNDLNLWDKIKSGEVLGFSLEGFFKYVNKLEMEKIPQESTISLEDESFDSFINKLIND